MNLIDAKFLQSAQSIEDSPPPSVAEVAFLGRSNVGKSSVLNSLTKHKGLAKSSSTPGKTQLINYFEIKFKTQDVETPYVYTRFVDLPGFGYAKVAKTLKAAWNRNLTEYLEKRPNVGKSSVLNSLTKHKGLAKSSSTPGKTQLINYFEIKFKTQDIENPYVYARFVDLPGFGYAKVAKTLKAAWNRNLTGYLEQRPNLQIFVHLIDARHSDLEIDKNVDDFVKHIKRGDQIIINAFTKIDKLNSAELNKLKRDFPDGIFVSNLKKKGIIDLQNKITEHLFGN